MKAVGTEQSFTEEITVHVGSCKTSPEAVSPEDIPIEFATVSIKEKDVTFFHDFLNTELLTSTGLVFVIVEGWRPWFDSTFKHSFPRFTLDISSLLYSNTFQSDSGHVMIPSFGHDSKGVEFVLENIYYDPKQLATSLETSLEIAKLRRLPIACWAREADGILNHQNRPVAIVLGAKGNAIFSRITKHYFAEDYYRWLRLEGCSLWIFTDVFYIFTAWDHVLEAARADLQRAEVNGFERRSSILNRTRSLHRSIAYIIEISEQLRIHSSSLAQIQRRVQRIHRGSLEVLMARLDNTSQMLDHYACTCQTMKEQLQNLLNLEFNTETVSQALAVSRISALAFIFIPPSFVAAVFGMTNFEVDPKWFPVAAVPLLIIIITVALTEGKLVSAWGNFRQQRSKNNDAVRAPLIPPVNQSDSHLVTSPESIIPLIGKQSPQTEITTSAPILQSPTNAGANSKESSDPPRSGRQNKLLDLEQQRNPDALSLTRHESSSARSSNLRIYQRRSYAVSGEFQSRRMRTIEEHSAPGARNTPSSLLEHYWQR